VILSAFPSHLKLCRKTANWLMKACMLRNPWQAWRMYTFLTSFKAPRKGLPRPCKPCVRWQAMRGLASLPALQRMKITTSEASCSDVS
jgi:hypothetical protein